MPSRSIGHRRAHWSSFHYPSSALVSAIRSALAMSATSRDLPSSAPYITLICARWETPAAGRPSTREIRENTISQIPPSTAKAPTLGAG